MSKLIHDFLNATASGGDHGSHSVYWIPLADFNQLPIKKWRRNRDPDMDRVKEIHQHMQHAKRMDGVIYLATCNGELVCYESNHRRMALVGIKDIEPILIDILWDVTDDTIAEEFRRLNKAVSVSDMYVTEEMDAMTRIQVIDLANRYAQRYPSLKVGTSRPQRPNFTTAMLQEEFYRVVRENNISVADLETRLSTLNNAMAEHDKTKLSDKVKDKCAAAGLWLFAWSNKLNASDLI